MTPVLRLSFRLLVSLALACFTLSCASYTQRTEQALSDFRSGRFEASAAAFADVENTDSEFLSGAEAGMVALTEGDWERARQHLDRAAAAVRSVEERALVSATGATESIGSWLINDSVRTYEGEGYERVYLHAALALAYLGLGSAQDARVEAKRANQLLEREEALYEKQYRAGGIGHLLSALSYELSGESADARIDYERMIDKDVGVELAGKALVRLSRQLGRDDLQQWVERFGDVPAPPAGAASIVVLAGVGLGPYKQEFALALPTGDGVLTFAVPTHAERPQPVQALRLDATAGNGAVLAVTTAVVEDVGAVARENLDDRIKWMAAKSVLRGVIKREVTQAVAQANDGSEGGEALVWLAGTLFSLATERADLRCWQTLPNQWQAARMLVSPGRQHLRLQALGGEDVDLGEVELQSGEWVFVIARSIDTRLYAHRLGGTAVGAGLGDPPAGAAVYSASDPAVDAARTLQLLQDHSVDGKGSAESQPQ
jgi:hypothetical protein